MLCVVWCVVVGSFGFKVEVKCLDPKLNVIVDEIAEVLLPHEVFESLHDYEEFEYFVGLGEVNTFWVRRTLDLWTIR